MSNSSQTPTRLDANISSRRLLSSFLIYWVIAFTIHMAILSSPTASISETQPPSFQANNTDCVVSECSIYDVLKIPISNQEAPWSRTSVDFFEYANTLVPMESIELMEELEVTEDVEPLEITSSHFASSIPSCLYLHVKDTTDSQFYWVPEFLDERVSENDILVDLSSAIDPDFAYELSDYFKQLVCLATEYEAGVEPFLGQVLVAEGIISRIRIGVYGPDIKAILVGGYEAEMDADGNLHFYRGSKEILEASESVQEAVDLALDGSRFSYLLLQATTELRNEQYGLQLDETYYQWGSIYHFSPEDIYGSRIIERSLNRVPVSFHYGGHIFYGYWLPKSAQLDL